MFFLPSIRAKLLALFLVAAVVPIALVGLLSYFNSLRAVETMVGNRTYRLSRTVGEDLEKKLTRRINDRILLVNTPVQEFLEAANAADVEAQARAHADLDAYMKDLFNDLGSYYNELFFADARGVPLVMCDRSGAVSGLAHGGPVSGVPTAPPTPPPAPSREQHMEELGRSESPNWDAEVKENVEFGEALAREMEALSREMKGGEISLRGLARLDSLRAGRQRNLGVIMAEQIARALERASVNTPEEPMEPGGEAPRAWPGRPSLPVSGIVSDQVTQAARRGASLGDEEWLLYFDRTEGQGVLRLVRPIFAVRDGSKRLGTLVADLRWDHVFPQHLANEHFGSLGQLAVVNAENGDILFHTNEELVGQRMTRADPMMAEVLRGGPGGGDQPWVKFGKGERTRLASVHNLEKVPWQVVSAAVPREFQKEARQAGFWNLLVASLVLLAAGGVLLVASNRVSRSIHVVTEGANEIAAGKLEHSIEVETHDEIQTLAEAFNSMTASLRENIALKETAARELEALNRSLEDRVRERTQELEALNEILNRANQELKELDRMKTNFLSTVSHEFRTPLTSIKAFAEILLDELAENERGEIRRFLGIINSESERLGRLIKNLLDMSRIESGRIIWAHDVFRVEEAVEAALEGLLPVFGEKNIQIRRDLSGGALLVEADRDRIQQVITNLCENAVKFSEKGKPLWVSCVPAGSDNGGFVEVAVRDEGVGIPKDHLEKIFERFWQVDNTETRAAGGTGLGLAISREIVEHHGGRIWAESDRGRGAVIRFTLPVFHGERNEHG